MFCCRTVGLFHVVTWSHCGAMPLCYRVEVLVCVLLGDICECQCFLAPSSISLQYFAKVWYWHNKFCCLVLFFCFSELASSQKRKRHKQGNKFSYIFASYPTSITKVQQQVFHCFLNLEFNVYLKEQATGFDQTSKKTWYFSSQAHVSISYLPKDIIVWN